MGGVIGQEMFNRGVVLQGVPSVVAAFRSLLVRAGSHRAGRELHRRLAEVGTAHHTRTLPDGFKVFTGRYARVSFLEGKAITGDGQGSDSAKSYGPARDDHKKGVDRVEILEAGTGADKVSVWMDPASRPGLPGFTTLHHELVHAYHYLSGRRLWYPDPRDRTKCGGRVFVGNHEESQTIGLRNYASDYSENALRRQSGIAERTTWHAACAI